MSRVCNRTTGVSWIKDEALLEVRPRWGDDGVRLNHGETEWKLTQLLYAYDAVLSAE